MATQELQTLKIKIENRKKYLNKLLATVKSMRREIAEMEKEYESAEQALTDKGVRSNGNV